MQNKNSSWGPLDIIRNVFRAWKLLLHPRVPASTKLFLPVIALIYFISPIDFMIGPLDDIAIIMIALNMFVQQANSALDEEQTAGHTADYDDNTIDTTWRVVDD